MKNTFYKLAVQISIWTSIAFAQFAFAIDSYDGTYLNIDKVIVGDTTYNNVSITVGEIISIAGGTPANDVDSFMPYTGYLLIPSVDVFGKIYTNVTIKVGIVKSVGGSQSACVSTSVANDGKFRIAEVDMRFDQINDFTESGLLVNSYEAVVPFIDRAKCVGFNTVLMKTNIPIDKETGLLTLYDPFVLDSNRDKNVPVDMWKVIAYAKSIGLKVFLQANPVYFVDDTGFSPLWLKLGPGFTTSNFFNTLSTYGSELAKKSEALKVDAVYVGTQQLGLDGAEYSSNWDNVISQYRKVFSGKLIYQSCYQCNSPVFDKVDMIALESKPILLRDKNYNLSSITSAYENTQNDAQHGGSDNLVNHVKQKYLTYKKPIILYSSFNPGDQAVGETVNLWEMLMNGASLSNFTPDYAQQSLRIAAFFEIISTKLSIEVVGFSLGEYDPWMEATWIINPQNIYGQQWHANSVLGQSLYRNEAAQSVFRHYFSKPWGYSQTSK